MPGAADFIQKAVHTLEAGALAVWIRRLLTVALIATFGVYHLYYFRGLATSQAMDQAQIGRQIASGHGWKTNLIRPRAAGQLAANHKNIQQRIIYDTYEAPLPPLADAIALSTVKSRWKMTGRDVIYMGDKVIAAESIILFLLSVLVLYTLAARLFDKRLALLACGFVLLSDMLWQYSLSGLPQMLMLLIFNCTLYAVVRALEAARKGGAVERWLAAAGVGFGLLALSHALTFWIFGGALVFLAIYFRSRIWLVGIVLPVVAILYSPWLLRNFVITGNPGGVAIYSVLDGVAHPEAGHMRRFANDLGGAGVTAFRDKMIANFTNEIAGLFGNLGWSVVALMFFPSLLHPFKRSEAAALRWMILAMWLGAMFGMSLYGVTQEQGVAANELNVLFVPIMTCFGLAFLLVLWNRLGIEPRFARLGFIAVLYLICALPVVFALPMFVPRTRSQIRWPPYVPPYISVINDWMRPNEIIASDMPWAVAWYADRRSLWLPETVERFFEFSDNGVFGGPVNGIYLTPISGNENKLGDILKGEYKEWARLVFRNVDIERFPLKWVALVGVENECVFYSDHDRRKDVPEQ